MTYEQLADFVHHRVRMSHVYQPVMLVALLQQGGRCSTTEIARSILAHGQSQIEYYEDVTKNMVGRVLRNHGFVENEDSSYSLLASGLRGSWRRAGARSDRRERLRHTRLALFCRLFR
jgi:ATP adenylyltransferase